MGWWKASWEDPQHQRKGGKGNQVPLDKFREINYITGGEKSLQLCKFMLTFGFQIERAEPILWSKFSHTVNGRFCT